MDFSLRSYDTNTNKMIHNNSDNRSMSREKQQEIAPAPTTSLLGMIGKVIESSSQPPRSIMMDSPVCVSQQIYPEDHNDDLPRPLNNNNNYYGAKSPMEDDVAGDFYEQATWKMYQRIQSARKEPLHINVTTAGSSHFLPSEDQLTNERPSFGRRRLQPRNNNSSNAISTTSDWSFHIDVDDEDEGEEKTTDEENCSNCVTEDDTDDDDGDDPIFDMDL